VFLKNEVTYQPATLPFDATHHAKLEEAYKFAVRERVRFEYPNNNWLMTGADLPAWDEYRREIEERLKESLARRKSLNEIYSSRLPEEIQLPPQYQTWRFNIRVKNPTETINTIFKEQLFASTHYASLAGIMSDGRAPVAESLADEVINLFNDHHFTVEMAERVCEIIVKMARW
jgi:dTDP-4-amino-4,6-dideoxygalactose transaminase